MPVPDSQCQDLWNLWDLWDRYLHMHSKTQYTQCQIHSQGVQHRNCAKNYNTTVHCNTAWTLSPPLSTTTAETLLGSPTPPRQSKCPCKNK